MASYAFGGEPFSPGVLGLEFARPIPVHAQRPGALMAVEAVRRAGRAKRSAGEITTDVGRPAYEPYEKPEIETVVTKKGKRKRVPTGRMLAVDPVPSAARAFLKLAEAHGFEVNLIELRDRCTVEGIDRARGVAFRAYWVRGRTNGGTWHERRERYEIVRDDRPVGVAALTKTGLKGKRAAGVGTTRLALVASRLGTAHTITELTRKVTDHGN